MKPKNFPGRKDIRRRKALARLHEKSEKTELDKKQIKILESRISDYTKNIRTKKDRSYKAKVN